jgi:hypothetical protein
MSESDADRSYVAQLGPVLRTGDPEQLRAFLVENARRFGDQSQVEELERKPADEVAELMHRMILSRSDLSALHAASQRWLAQRNVRLPREAPDRRN